MGELTGQVLHIQRLSTEDGPGIRTTVFFKGCPLRCKWCHNPESLLIGSQVQWLEGRCIHCDTCLEVCKHHGLMRSSEGALIIDRQVCDACGECTEVCPANALEKLGRKISVDELVTEVLKDRSFYNASGGGVTASGGEPGMQPEFVAEFLRRVKDAGVSTALDTCGFVSRHSLDKILPWVDLVLYDIKESDPDHHRAFTGRGNEEILDNLIYLKETMADHPNIHLWVRTPMIPGATATRENLRNIGHFLAKNMNGTLERWELCAFNNLCRDKYERLGMHWEFLDAPLLTEDEMIDLTECARSSGICPEIVHTTGARQQR